MRTDALQRLVRFGVNAVEDHAAPAIGLVQAVQAGRVAGHSGAARRQRDEHHCLRVAQVAQAHGLAVSGRPLQRGWRGLRLPARPQQQPAQTQSRYAPSHHRHHRAYNTLWVSNFLPILRAYTIRIYSAAGSVARRLLGCGQGGGVGGVGCAQDLCPHSVFAPNSPEFPENCRIRCPLLAWFRVLIGWNALQGRSTGRIG